MNLKKENYDLKFYFMKKFKYKFSVFFFDRIYFN